MLFTKSQRLLWFTAALAGSSLTMSSPAAAQPDKINADRDARLGNPGFGAGRTGAYKAAPAGYDDAMAKQMADAHRTAKGAGYKYIYLPAKAAANPELANELRVAAAKAWNHLSWKSDLDIPEDVSDGAGLVFAISPQKIWDADATKNWGFLANCTPKRNIAISPAPRGDCKSFGVDDPVSIPRFVYNATNGGPYANIHKTPPFFDSFERKYKLGKIEAVATHHEAIVCGPRISAYRYIDYNGQKLLYSFTSDEFDGRDNGDIRYKNAPTDRDQRETGALNAGPGDGGTAVASEWWIQLPNGFLYYSIHGEGSQERGRAEFPFAIDPANWKQDAILATGRSCITCHANGIQSAPSDADKAGLNGWTSNEDLNILYADSRGKFQKSMRAIVDAMSDGDGSLNERMVNGTVEPVSKAIAEIEGPYPGRNSNYSCESFCGGKFGARRRNLCDSLPVK
jgi:hypothetical protein